MKNFKIALRIFSLLFLLGACTGQTQEQSSTEQVNQARFQYDSLQKLAAQTAQTYHAMDDAALIAKLAEQSKEKKEPFNSLAYRELVTRKGVDPVALVSQIKVSKNAGGLLPLLLLRKLYDTVYKNLPVKDRADILVDALEQSTTFNVWGIPNFYLEDASRAILECDSVPASALRKMLSDQRPALLYGSKESMLSQRYHYRHCDYALFFLEKMQGNSSFKIPVAPAGRDSIIKQMIGR
jgi:hypothetical protein